MARSDKPPKTIEAANKQRPALRQRGRVDRSPFGKLLAQARRRRELSQMRLALSAGISARHLAFLESGRSRPSAQMVTRLVHSLALSAAEEDQFLLAAGYAPRHLPTLAKGDAAWGFRREGGDRLAREAFEVALLLQRLPSVEDAFAVAGANLASFGLDHFFAGRLRLHAGRSPEIAFHPGGRPPLAWLAHYAQSGYRPYDPLVRETARANAPFFWEEVLSRPRPRSAPGLSHLTQQLQHEVMVPAGSFQLCSQ
jgi:transcriptional regulator with XRE-family HTH domain